MNYEMIYTLGYITGAIFGVWLLWVLYVFVMALKRVRESGRLSKTAMAWGLAAAIPAYILDVAVNLTIGTVLFLDFPREATLSARLSRYYSPEGTDWRCKFAGWLASTLLDPFDPDGKHVD
jgi:hypothetical protein